MGSSLFPARYNLINASWLPARRRSGVVEQIPPWRVNDRIDEDPFVALAWPRPDFNGATHEWMIGVLSTAAAPMDDEDWEDWWLDPPAPEILRERFVRIAGAFNLDGPGPLFLQDLDPLEGADGKEITALLIDAPGANTLRNNADLFVKRGGISVMGRAAAAMGLYTLSTYAPTGGAGHRTSLRGGGPLTTLIVALHQDYGDTLWGRLWPNVETAEQVSARSGDAALSDDPKTNFSLARSHPHLTIEAGWQTNDARRRPSPTSLLGYAASHSVAVRRCAGSRLWFDRCGGLRGGDQISHQKLRNELHRRV